MCNKLLKFCCSFIILALVNTSPMQTQQTENEPTIQLEKPSTSLEGSSNVSNSTKTLEASRKPAKAPESNPSTNASKNITSNTSKPMLRGGDDLTAKNTSKETVLDKSKTTEATTKKTISTKGTEPSKTLKDEKPVQTGTEDDEEELLRELSKRLIGRAHLPNPDEVDSILREGCAEKKQCIKVNWSTNTTEKMIRRKKKIA